MSEGDWTWELAPKAEDDLATLASHEQERILDKLDEIVESPWRDPPDYGEPLRNSPHKKVRIGEFRLSVTFRRNEHRIVSPESSVAAGPTRLTTIDCARQNWQSGNICNGS